MRTQLPGRTAALLSVSAIILVSGYGWAKQAAYAEEGSVANRSTYGDVGLLDMPNARMAVDGSFGINYARFGNTTRFALTFQALPWLDAQFRYSRPFQQFFDRSFGVKARLFPEGGTTPEISFGARDILGTGIYGSEYIVASKRIWDFDVTAGVGWGRLADSNTLPNPLGLLSSGFKDRPTLAPSGQGLANVNTTGTFNSKVLLHGRNIGLFGGIDWQTPIENLAVIAELSSDKYRYDSLGLGGIHTRAPVNIGLSYQPVANTNASIGWYYGTTFGATLTISVDANSNIPSAFRIGPQAPPAVIRSTESQQTALLELTEMRQTYTGAKHNMTWVPTKTSAEQLRTSLLQAFHTTSPGVRDVEFEGTSVIVDVHIDSAIAQKQCVGYAEVAHNVSQRITSVALSDFNEPQSAIIICQTKQSPVTLNETSTSNSADAKIFEDKLRAGLGEQALRFTGLAYTPSEVWVYYENYRYLSEAEAAGRIIRVLMRDAPPSVELFHLIPSNLGVPTQIITATRSSFERILATPYYDKQSGTALSFGPAPSKNVALYQAASSLYPELTYSFAPKLTQRVFDPDAPVQFMVYGDAQALLRLAPGLNIEVEGTGTIWSNYSFSRPADSDLPHVRSDILEYLKHGKYGISALDLNYRSRVSPNVYFELRGGLLEDMFAGVGGQVIWRPVNSRISFGADMYQVWQREYHRLFQLQPYQVLTGHLSAYYRSPWYQLDFAVHAGRYLAGDSGATIEIIRHFNSGVQIGAWATFTNVPFSKFGEGSFDKGIIIHIPLQWGLPIFSKSAYDLHLNSLTRDGGQRLAGDDSLYDTTLGTSDGELQRNINEFSEP